MLKSQKKKIKLLSKMFITHKIRNNKVQDLEKKSNSREHK